MSNKCSICLEMIADKNCCITECGHHFCLDCFVTHFNKNRNCPLCKTQLILPNTSENVGGINVDRIMDIIYSEEDISRIRYQLEQIIPNSEERKKVSRIVREFALSVGLKLSDN
jgi:hypothetical protein